MAGKAAVLWLVGVASLLGGCAWGDGAAGGEKACEPGERRCEDNVVAVCAADGAGFELDPPCEGGAVCLDGDCVPWGGGGGLNDVSASPDAGGSPADGGADVLPGFDSEPPDVVLRELPEFNPWPDAGEPDETGSPDAGGDASGEPDGSDAGEDDADVTTPLECGNGTVDPGETCDPAAPAGQADCNITCQEPDGCSGFALTGAPATCNVACVPAPVSQPIAGDGCCPAGIDPALDPDCPPCGNGVVDPGEACDPAVVGTCPASCPPKQGCSVWTLQGSAATCSAVCQATTITVAQGGDGCCPEGGLGVDPDCAGCGNGIKDPGETCDPSSTGDPCPAVCPPPEGCTAWGLTGSAATCNALCSPFPITASGPKDGCCPPGAGEGADPDCPSACGNGVVGGGEQCDTSNLAGATCLMLGAPGAGTPVCTAECTFDTLPCLGAHRFAYTKLSNLLAVGDLLRVRWHPSGTFALVLAQTGKVLRYDAATKQLALVGSLFAPADFDVSPDGTFFAFVGLDSDNGPRLWKAPVGAGGTVTLGDPALGLTGLPVAIRSAADGTFIIGSRGPGALNTMIVWTAAGGIAKTTVYSALGGITSLALGQPPVYSGALAALTTEALNGADAHSYIVPTNQAVGNGWTAGFGTPGGGDYRPGGPYFLLGAANGNQVLAFDGAWKPAALPGVAPGAGVRTVAFKPDGTRAIIAGGSFGAPLKALVAEYRPLSAPTFDPAALLDSTIAAFDGAPWFGTSAVAFLSADWRPASACPEGLLVGTDPGTPAQPTFGMILRFYDPEHPACAP